MKSLTLQLKEICDALVAVTSKTYHYEKPAAVKAPYIVWAELGEDTSFHSDNMKVEQQVVGYVEYFTQTEYDTTIDAIQEALNSVCAWALDSVLYEDETKLIHYVWAFKVI